MIGFEVDGEFLDLTPGFKVPIEWESGLFSDEFVLNGVSTLPVTFAFTPKNKRLLKHFHIVENNLKNLQVECRLYLGGNLWCIGTLTVAVKGESFDTDFSEITPISISSEKTLLEVLNDEVVYIINKFIRNWTIEGDYTLATTKIEFIINVANIDYIFSTPITGSLANDIDELYNQLLTEHDIVEIFTIERISNPTFSTENIKLTMRNGDTIDSNLNLTILLIEGSKFVSSSSSWPAYQREQIRNRINTDVNNIWPNSNFCFPTIKNENFYENKNPSYTDNHAALNYYGKLPSVSPQYLWNLPGNPTAYSLSPQLFLPFILNKIGEKLGFKISGDFTEIEDLYNRLILYNNRAIDLIGSNFTDVYEPIYNFWQGKFIIGEHLPDVTLKDLFTSLSKYFGIGLFYRNGTLNLTTKNYILKDSVVIDWTEKTFRIYDELTGNYTSGFTLKYSKDTTDDYLSEIVKDIEGVFIGQFDELDDLPKINVNNGDFAAVKANKKLYRFSIKRQGNRLIGNYDFFSNYLHDFSYVTGVKDIDTLASQTADFLENESGNRQMLLPRIDHTGASKELEMPNKGAGIRYLLYWGLQPAKKSTGIPGGETPPEEIFETSSDPNIVYPLALMDNKNIDGTRLGSYKLRFEDDDGVFENFHRTWLEFILNSKKLKVLVLLSTAELLQLDLRQKIKIGASQFLISKIATQIGNQDKLVACTIDLYKI